MIGAWSNKKRPSIMQRLEDWRKMIDDQGTGGTDKKMAAHQRIDIKGQLIEDKMIRAQSSKKKKRHTMLNHAKTGGWTDDQWTRETDKRWLHIRGQTAHQC